MVEECSRRAGGAAAGRARFSASDRGRRPVRRRSRWRPGGAVRTAVAAASALLLCAGVAGAAVAAPAGSAGSGSQGPSSLGSGSQGSGSQGSGGASVNPLGPSGSLGSLDPGSLRVDPGTGPNPIISTPAADPSVVRAPDGTFYLYATADDWMDGQGVRQMPIYRSADLVNWTFAGTVFGAAPAWVAQDGGMLWAPDVHLVNGTYVVYYSKGNVANPCIGRATAPSPTGPFTDHGPVFCSDTIGVGGTIDPYVYYGDGAPTMFFGNFQGIYAVTLTADGTAPAGTPPVRVAGNAYEAPYIQKHAGMYYLYVSAGHCCNGAASDYRVYVGRSQSLTGPYLDAEGRDLDGDGGDLILSGNVSWLGPGHNAVVTDDAGADWMIYHAAPRLQPTLPNGGPQNRQGMIDRISWVGGWPRVGDGTPSSTAPAVPTIGG